MAVKSKTNNHIFNTDIYNFYTQKIKDFQDLQ